MPSQRTNISEFVKIAYLAYLILRIGDQDKAWAPHNICKIYANEQREQGNNYHLAFLWFGGSRRTTEMIPTFTSQKLLDITRKFDRN